MDANFEQPEPDFVAILERQNESMARVDWGGWFSCTISPFLLELVYYT